MEMSAPLSAKAEHTHNILTNRHFLILTLSDWGSQKLNTLFLQDKEEEAPQGDMNRIMRMNAPEWGYILMGCISAMANGAVQPVMAILFSEMLGVKKLPLFKL